MNKFEKLTPKEEKVVLTAYAIQSINNIKERYTATDVFNVYNSILVNHHFEKVALRTFQGYLAILKKLKIVNALHEIVYRKGSQIYYQLTTTIKKCAELIKGFFKRENFNKFVQMKTNYFKNNRCTPDLHTLSAHLDCTPFKDYISSINSPNIIPDDLVDVVEACDFESSKKEEIIKELEVDVREKANLTMSIRQQRINSDKEAVNKWLSKSQIKDNPFALFLAKREINKDICIKLLNQIQAKVLSKKVLPNGINSTSRINKSHPISFRETSSQEYKPLPTENDLDEAIDNIRKDFLTRAEGCYPIADKLEEQLAEIKQEYMKDLYTVTFLLQKQKFANYARCMDKLTKAIPLINIEQHKKEVKERKIHYTANSVAQYAIEQFKLNYKLAIDPLYSAGRVFIGAQGDYLDSKWDFYYYHVFNAIIKKKLESTAVENLQLLPEECIQINENTLDKARKILSTKK